MITILSRDSSHVNYNSAEKLPSSRLICTLEFVEAAVEMRIALLTIQPKKKKFSTICRDAVPALADYTLAKGTSPNLQYTSHARV